MESTSRHQKEEKQRAQETLCNCDPRRFIHITSSRADAERAALAYCREAGGSASGCEIAVWGHKTCLALAASAGGAGGNTRGYAWPDARAISERDAVNARTIEGGSSCKVAVSFSSGATTDSSNI